MSKRKRISRKGSKALFKATAAGGKAKRINYEVPAMRGGIRL